MGDLLKEIMGAIDFLLKLCAGAPFGVWAVVFGLVCANVAQAWLKHWIPVLFPLPEFYPNRFADPVAEAERELQLKKSNQQRSDRRDFFIDTVATFSIGFFAVWLPYQTRNGVLLGIMVGFMAPNVLNWLMVIGRPLLGAYQRKFGSKPTV